VTAFLLAAWLAASQASHARYSPVGRRGGGDLARISPTSPQQPSRNTLAICASGNDDGRRNSFDNGTVLGVVEVKPKKSKRLFTWTCQFCNMEFETENYSQRYCNRTHKELAYRLRKADRLKNAPEREFQLTLIPSTETLESASKPVYDP
jgi:hypothetical protein